MGKNRTLFFVLTWNRPNVVKRCLALFTKHNPTSDIVVVDNGSEAPTQKVLEQGGYDVLRQNKNVGAFRGFRAGWLAGVDRGYDFVVPLSNDVLPQRTVPLKEAEAYLDGHGDVAFMSIYRKIKGKRVNLIQRKLIRYDSKEKLGPYDVWKCNQHYSTCPNMVKSSIIKNLLGRMDSSEMREWRLMFRFEELKLRGSKLRPACFLLPKEGSRNKRGWRK